MTYIILSVVLPIIVISLLIVEIVRNSWYLFDLHAKVRQLEGDYQELYKRVSARITELAESRRELTKQSSSDSAKAQDQS